MVLFALALAALVCAVNALGRGFERHEAWLARLDLRVENLHKAREAERRRSLQLPPSAALAATALASTVLPAPAAVLPRTARPPPLSEASTLEVSADMLGTMKRNSKKENDP